MAIVAAAADCQHQFPGHVCRLVRVVIERSLLAAIGSGRPHLTPWKPFDDMRNVGHNAEMQSGPNSAERGAMTPQIATAIGFVRRPGILLGL